MGVVPSAALWFIFSRLLLSSIRPPTSSLPPNTSLSPSPRPCHLLSLMKSLLLSSLALSRHA